MSCFHPHPKQEKEEQKKMIYSEISSELFESLELSTMLDRRLKLKWKPEYRWIELMLGVADILELGFGLSVVFGVLVLGDCKNAARVALGIGR